MINLNEERFNGRENAPKIFNDGKAGEVVVKVRVEKKKVEDNPNSPDWKIYWGELEGEAEVNTGFYYLDPNRENYETNLSIQGRILKDILKALYGEDAMLPSAPDYKTLLDSCMQQIIAKTGSVVKAGFTFGNIKRPSKRGYLQLKNTFPFITGDLEEPINFNWEYDLKHRPQSDSETTSESTTSEDTPVAEEKRPW